MLIPKNIARQSRDTLKPRNWYWKEIITLDGKTRTKIVVYRPKGQAKEVLGNKTIVEQDPRVLPKHKYGIDVMLEILRLRKQGKSFTEIARELKQQHPKLPKMDEKTIQRLHDAILAIVSQKRRSETIKKIKERGWTVLAVDGLQPKKGLPALYIVYDVIEGEPIFARILKDQSADSIASMLEECRDMLEGVEIRGVVSDYQRELVIAIKKVFGDVKHQLCQFHFIREVAKPVVGEDRKLAKEVKKHLRRLPEYKLGKKGQQSLGRSTEL